MALNGAGAPVDMRLFAKDGHVVEIWPATLGDAAASPEDDPRTMT